jgi:hypothetical protein
MSLGIPFMLVRKESKLIISRLTVRLEASSIYKALDEDDGLEGNFTSVDTFAIRQRAVLVTRFSLGESKREIEGDRGSGNGYGGHSLSFLVGALVFMFLIIIG